MSITFLQEQNGYKEIADVWWVGQTITLEVTTKVYYFYFEGYYGLDRDPIYCDVYLTDDAHHPIGSPVASARCILHRWEKHQIRHRRRFTFYNFIMEAGVEHFFLIYDKIPTWKINSRIYIRTGDSIYEDGMLYYSTNSGDDWTEYPNDDLIFALTGTPEVPPPPPEAPVDNFAILDLEQEVTATGIIITVTTSVPCHLYCYWTDHEPGKHLIPILSRGLELHTQLEYCFVDWHENEQEEDFDTLIHTFTKEPWAHCETRWLTFRAKVMDEWVKSVGPIFKKHRVEPTEPTEIEFAAVPNTGYIYAYGADWYTAWSAEEGLPMESQMTYLLRLYPPGYRPITISRGILRFDTSALPDDCEIVSATLKIMFFSTYYPTNYGEIRFVPALGCGDDMAVGDYGALRLNTASVCDPIIVPTLLLEIYYELDLYPDAFTLISKTGQSRIGIRTHHDINNHQPVSGEYQSITWYGDYYEPSPKPDARLIVRYL